MTVTIEQLGRRAAACKAWPGYLPGMADVDGYRVLSCYDCGTYRIAQDGDAFDSDVIASPDFSDRATLALLRDIVARAYGGDDIHISLFNRCGIRCARVEIWDIMKSKLMPFVYVNCPSDFPIVEALVCALEAAPGVAP